MVLDGFGAGLGWASGVCWVGFSMIELVNDPVRRALTLDIPGQPWVPPGLPEAGEDLLRLAQAAKTCQGRRPATASRRSLGRS